MTLVLIGLPFFKSISQGWMTYYNRSSGPKFTEEQIRMADHAAGTLDTCYPVGDLIDPITHSEVCKSLSSGIFTEASINLELGSPDLDLRKAGCIEALKIGVWLLGTCAPESIRLATLNLLACEYYFPTI
jgi:hypothetical protein